MTYPDTDEMPHAGCVDEWVFAVWLPDASAGLISGHRLLGPRAWYWSAVVEMGYPLFHLTEWDVIVRPDPFVVKAPEMWAEHHCDDPMRQWTVGNEGYFAALDDPDEALGRAYGMREPMATDLEWYAVGAATAVDGGYEQPGVAHGIVELRDRPQLEFVEAPAHRWRRWVDPDARPGLLGPIELPAVVAHTGLRAPFSFPDGSVSDWVLTRDGWRTRRAGSASARPASRGATLGDR